MLNSRQRAAILELHSQGIGTRKIARTLKLSRGAVKKVTRSRSEKVPDLERPFKAEPYRQEILELYATCKGNLVRVHEELENMGAQISYPALTSFCRREGIGKAPIVRVGRYHFLPGQEMQHDTSPHTALIGGRSTRVQTASAALGFSHMLFFQGYPRFRRFECKIFHTKAFAYFEGSTCRVMIDNTHVVVLQGTGATMVPVPEMAAFAERYGFRFEAHEIGDANRSARVERSMRTIETNFLAGRSFTDWNDLNQRAREWCDKYNSTYKRHLRASPRELFVTEKANLRPLPLWCPEPYRLHHRIVDVYGYVAVDTNRYSVPAEWIGRRVEVRETEERIVIEIGRFPSISHVRIPQPMNKRITLPEHRRPRGQGHKGKGPCAEEQAILKAAPEIEPYVTALKTRGRKQTTITLRKLLRMVREYPRLPLRTALREAQHYGLYDLDRVERMVLRCIAHEYFRLDTPDTQKEPEDDEGRD